MIQIAKDLPPAFIIAAFFYLVTQQYRFNNRVNLEELVVRALSISAIPTAVVLLVCAFKPDLLSQLSGFNIHIAVAGLVLLYISVKALVTPPTSHKNEQSKKRECKPETDGDR
jgi:hypothetical protein